MLGLGGTELLFLLGIVLVLFGPTLLAFWLGYTVGKNRAPGAQPPAPAPAPAPDAPTDEDSEESAQ